MYLKGRRCYGEAEHEVKTPETGLRAWQLLKLLMRKTKLCLVQYCWYGARNASQTGVFTTSQKALPRRRRSPANVGAAAADMADARSTVRRSYFLPGLLAPTVGTAFCRVICWHLGSPWRRKEAKRSDRRCFRHRTSGLRACAGRRGC